MTKEEAEAYVKIVFANAAVIVRQLAKPYIIQEVEKLCSKGGKIYSQVLGASLAAAAGWYGKYTPKVYQRGYTFLQEGNIEIGVGGITVDEASWNATWHVVSVSEHASFSDGFIMPNGKERPGGFIVANGGKFFAEVDVPDDIVISLWQEAVAQAATM